MFAVFFTGCLLFTACSKESGSFESGKRQDLRIISLTPAASSILSDLGYKENIIGRCSEDFIIPNTKSIGSILFFSLENILTLKPTVVVYQKFQELRLKPLFGQKGIHFIAISPKNFHSIIGSVKRLEQKLSIYKTPSLKKLDEFKNIISKIDEDRKFNYVAVVDRDFSFKRFFVAGKTSYVSEMLMLLGGQNLFSQNRDYFQVESEKLMLFKKGILFDFSSLRSNQTQVFSLKRLDCSQKFLTIPDLRIKEKLNFLRLRLKGF